MEWVGWLGGTGLVLGEVKKMDAVNLTVFVYRKTRGNYQLPNLYLDFCRSCQGGASSLCGQPQGR